MISSPDDDGNLVTRAISKFANGKIMVPLEFEFELYVIFNRRVPQSSLGDLYDESKSSWKAILKDDPKSLILCQGDIIVELELTTKQDIFSALFENSHSVGIDIELKMPIKELKIGLNTPLKKVKIARDLNSQKKSFILVVQGLSECIEFGKRMKEVKILNASSAESKN